MQKLSALDSATLQVPIALIAESGRPEIAALQEVSKSSARHLHQTDKTQRLAEREVAEAAAYTLLKSTIQSDQAEIAAQLMSRLAIVELVLRYSLMRSVALPSRIAS